MKPNELPRWLDTAKDNGAKRLDVRRARRNGQPASAQQVFAQEDLDGLDVERLLERMREDVLARRLPQASFELRAQKADGEVSMADRLLVSRDDVTTEDLDAGSLDASMAGLVRIFVASTENAHKAVREQARETVQELRAMNADIVAKFLEAEGRRAEVLEAAFQMAQMREEREEKVRASQERRELGKVAIEELSPILGAGLSHVLRNATPAWGAFAKKLQASGKLDKVLEVLDAEELALISQALGFTFPSKGKRAEADTEPPPADATNGTAGG